MAKLSARNAGRVKPGVKPKKLFPFQKSVLELRPSELIDRIQSLQDDAGEFAKRIGDDRQLSLFLRREKPELDFLANVTNESRLEKLDQQLRFLRDSRRYQHLAPVFDLIAQSLDDGGFAAIDYDLASEHLPALRRDDFAQALEVFKREMDPPGIGASDLRETLCIQIRRRFPREAKLAEELNGGWLPEWESYFRLGEFGKLCTALGWGPHEKRILSKLTGSPLGDRLESEAEFPDLCFEKDPTSPYGTVARLVFGDDFGVRFDEKSFMADLELAAADREFLKKMKGMKARTRDLMSNIRFRQVMLMKLGNWLIEQMPAFFTKGWEYFETRNLKEAAPVLEVNPSTVTRLVKGKSVVFRTSSHNTTLPLEKLFSRKIKDSCSYNKTNAMIEIKKLINGEDKHQPLSDMEIARLLNRMGFTVCRRFVQDLRRYKMKIPTSRDRKIR